MFSDPDHLSRNKNTGKTLRNLCVFMKYCDRLGHSKEWLKRSGLTPKCVETWHFGYGFQFCLVKRFKTLRVYGGDHAHSGILLRLRNAVTTDGPTAQFPFGRRAVATRAQRKVLSLGLNGL